MFTIETLETADNKDAYDEALDMIRAQGAEKCLGSGLYGRVYGVPDDKHVYKISSLDKGDGYFEYIKVLSKQKTHNPYTPKIYGVRVIKNGTNSVLVVAMEKLNPLDNKERDLAYWFSRVLDSREGRVADAPKALGIKVTVPKPLSNALKILQTAHENAGNSVGWDLHCGNFMMRGKQVVCTDPLA